MNQQTLGHLAALFTIVNWGTTFIGTKILLTDFSPVEILVFRFMLGVVALYIMCPRLLYFKNWREELTFAGAGLTGACLYYLMENIALTFTTAANVGVIVTVAPLSTALLSWAMGEERPKGWFFLGFAVAMSGICLISFSGVSELSLDWRGDLLAVGATVVWAVYCMLLKRIGTYGYSVLQTTPDLNLVVGTEDSCVIGAYRAMIAAGAVGDDRACFSGDAVSEVLAAMKEEDSIYRGSVDLIPYTCGYETAMAMYDMVVNGAPDECVYEWFEPAAFTKEEYLSGEYSPIG